MFTINRSEKILKKLIPLSIWEVDGKEVNLMLSEDDSIFEGGEFIITPDLTIDNVTYKYAIIIPTHVHDMLLNAEKDDPAVISAFVHDFLQQH